MARHPSNGLTTHLSAGGGSRAISWLIPNSTTLGSLDSYIVSIDELEDTFGASTIAFPQRPTSKRCCPHRLGRSQMAVTLANKGGYLYPADARVAQARDKGLA